jgi:predicted small lipoprotein YifL
MRLNEGAGGGQAPTGDGQGDEAMRKKHVALCAALLVLAFSVTACGKRGPLEPPPDPAKTAKADRVSGEGGEVIEERKEDVKEPHDPFILDALL